MFKPKKLEYLTNILAMSLTSEIIKFIFYKT